MNHALLLALALTASAANGPQPPLGRALTKAEYDAITALLRPGLDQKDFAARDFAMREWYGEQPDGKPCKFVMSMRPSARPLTGAYDVSTGETVIEGFLHGSPMDYHVATLEGGFIVQPRRTDLTRAERRRVEANLVAVSVAPDHFSMEQLARFTNDTVVVRLRAPGEVEEVVRRSRLAFVDTSEFSCRVNGSQSLYHARWQARLDELFRGLDR